MKSAFSDPSQTDEADLPRRTVSINISLMWEILDYTNVDTRRNHAKGGLLLHESLFPATEGTDEEGDTVETQFFHNSTREVDTTDGGQAMPPFSDHIVRQKTRMYTRQSRGERQNQWMLPGPATHLGSSSNIPPESAGQPMAGPQGGIPQYASWPGPFPLNASVMDITHDPFVQFQDPGSPYLGLWEVGNL